MLKNWGLCELSNLLIHTLLVFLLHVCVKQSRLHDDNKVSKFYLYRAFTDKSHKVLHNTKNKNTTYNNVKD